MHVASEAGISRAPYRETWLSGANPHATPMRVEVLARFDGRPQPARATYLVPAGERWTVALSELYAATVSAWTNARVEVRCDQWCAVTAAVWPAPIGPGVSPAVYVLPAICQEQ